MGRSGFFVEGSGLKLTPKKTSADIRVAKRMANSSLSDVESVEDECRDSERRNDGESQEIVTDVGSDSQTVDEGRHYRVRGEEISNK